MKIVDPARFLGVDSGMRVLVATKAEAAVLMRAVAILERGHELVTAVDQDHQDQEDIAEALCTGPAAIRHLVDEGLVVA